MSGQYLCCTFGDTWIEFGDVLNVNVSMLKTLSINFLKNVSAHCVSMKTNTENVWAMAGKFSRCRNWVEQGLIG